MIPAPFFEQSWENAKKDIFRLESLPEYRVDYDLENFETFQKGEQYVEKSTEWFDKLEKMKRKGIKMQRVRIIDLPLSIYLKYEIDFWQYSKTHGENFLFLERKGFEEIKSKLNVKPLDFWMFDDNALVIFKYNSKGEFLGEEKIDNDNVIKTYATLKNELVKISTPMEVFLRNLTI